jgi:hypothetical protein
VPTNGKESGTMNLKPETEDCTACLSLLLTTSTSSLAVVMAYSDFPWVFQVGSRSEDGDREQYA